MTVRSSRFRYLVAVSLVLTLGIGVWAYYRQGDFRGSSSRSRLGGMKFGDKSRSGPAPRLTILSPTGKTPLRRGRDMDVAIRLEVAPGGELPSTLRVSIECNEQEFGSAYMVPTLQENGTHHFQTSMRLPPRKGRIRFYIRCEDRILPTRFSSPREMVTIVTAEATADLEVR